MSKTYQKPLWLTLAEQLVIQARRDLQQKRRRLAKQKLAKQQAKQDYLIEGRAHFPLEQHGRGHGHTHTHTQGA